MGEAKRYDLEDRTLNFAKQVSEFVRSVPKSLSNQEFCRQLVRSSGSVGANYIEANESLGRKDFVMRVKICKKESKESRYWLQLISSDGSNDNMRDRLIQESTELMKIFGAIIEKSK